MPKKETKQKKTKVVAVKKSSKAKGASLLVVESPAKERTISRLLKGEFIVKSSFGHVRDLPVRKMGVDVHKGFKPDYQVLPRAKKIIADLKKIAGKSPFVYLATDHDREGESIAWHLSDILELGSDRARRITFHEITLPAIQEALSSPRDIDQNLVGAQQARRVIDRLVGYELSPLLWEKIKKGLSAGRVQSVAVRLLVEREKEIKEFPSDSFWTMAALFEKKGFPAFSADLTSWNGKKVEETRTFDLFAESYRVRLTSLKTAEDVKNVESALENGNFKVISAEGKETRRRAPAPFSTSTLQQAASLKLGFTAERTMRTAQSLYEGVDLGNGETVGLITYMRTDSFFVSKIAMAEASSFIKDRFGLPYAPDAPPVYQTKSMAAQEAHEAIRPTSVLRDPQDLKALLNSEQFKLYDLIWKRFVASQMKEALYDTVSVDIECGPAVFHATGRTLKFDGFLKVYSADKEGEESSEEASSDDKILPPLTVGDVLKRVGVKSEDRKTGPPARYNEASLIRTMEKHGIGRPSTYAPTIKTIVERGYVRRQKGSQLLVTDLGTLVIEKLKVHFPEVVSLGYTAEVENRLDKVAEGQESWTSVVQDFYKPFAAALKKAEKEMTVSRIEPKKTDEICPLCGSPMLLRESRFGPYISCSRFPECKGKIALNAEGQKLEPEKTDEICDICGKGMVIRTGRKGRFLACSGYPACKNTFSLDAEGKKIQDSRPLATSRLCDKCQKSMWIRKGKRGYFLACSGFPRCRNLKPLSKDEGQSVRIEAEALFLKNLQKK